MYVKIPLPSVSKIENPPEINTPAISPRLTSKNVKQITTPKAEPVFPKNPLTTSPMPTVKAKLAPTNNIKTLEREVEFSGAEAS